MTTRKPRERAGAGVQPVDLVRRLAQFGPAYMRWVGRHLPDDGTSAARLRLLATLAEQGPMPMRGLTQALSVSPQNVSVMVEALEGQGLVERSSDPDDRRVVQVGLSALGRERVAAGMASHQVAVSALFECLSADERAQFARCLDRLNAELAASTGAPGPRQPPAAVSAPIGPSPGPSPAPAARRTTPPRRPSSRPPARRG